MTKITGYFVGNLLNAGKNKLVPCVCYKISDNEYFYEVFELTTLKHFRRDLEDSEISSLTAINAELFKSLRDIPHSFL